MDAPNRTTSEPHIMTQVRGGGPHQGTIGPLGVLALLGDLGHHLADDGMRTMKDCDKI